jgi:hypothetical protein
MSTPKFVYQHLRKNINITEDTTRTQDHDWYEVALSYAHYSKLVVSSPLPIQIPAQTVSRSLISLALHSACGWMGGACIVKFIRSL